MPFSGRLSSSGLQSLAFPRRELLSKFVAVAMATAAAKRIFEIPSKYPAPKFAIGDQILSPYADEYGDVQENLPPEFGEIMGVCWSPRNEAWEYIINWTGGDSTPETYPVFDEVLIDESSLRLVSRA
jgi:hypothetical protein